MTSNETWKSSENDDEELQYGPGIVNKLKSRYLSRTLREKNLSGEPRRPALRRATSLENWLDKDGAPPLVKEKSVVTSPRPVSFMNESNEAQTQKNIEASKEDTPPAASKKPDHLLLSKETIIIIEKGKQDVKSPTAVESKPVSRPSRRSLPTNTRYNVEDAELPAPDTVRQVKRLFESGLRNRRSQSAGPPLHRVPLTIDTDAHKKKVAPVTNGVVQPRKMVKQPSITLEDKPVIITKPLLSPKPVLGPKPNIPFKRPVRTSLPDLKKAPIIPPSTPSPTAVSKPLPISPIPSPPVKKDDAKPKPDDAVKKNVVAPVANTVAISPAVPAKKDEPKPKVARSESIDQPDNGRKMISRTALENIRKESVSVNFKFDKKDEKTTTGHSKQIGIIRPQVKTEKEKPVVIKEQAPPTALPETVAKEIAVKEPAKVELSTKIEPKLEPKTVEISVNKSQGTNKTIEGKLPSVDAINTALIKNEGTKAPAKKNSSKSWHNESTTTVFNFINSPKKVDYIRNEGGSTTIHLYKPNDSGITKLPDFDGGESSDFIDDQDILKRPPSPCNVHFEGANIILQKSVLQKRSRVVKLKISFNDDMTRLFEYPSEASLLEDDSLVQSPEVEEYLVPLESLKDKASTGGLSSYTPSKVLIENTFTLGISSSVDALPSSFASKNASSSSSDAVEEAEYLRPSEEGTTWSSETTSDLLF